jgi:hypothetical protein
LCIHTIQLLPNYLRSRLLHRWLLSQYLSIYIGLYDLFVGLTSQQNSQCDFGLELHAFLGQYCYFYNDFTIKASLLNLIHSAIAAFISLSSVVIYYIYMLFPS